jgi:hypothetical protein
MKIVASRRAAGHLETFPDAGLSAVEGLGGGVLTPDEAAAVSAVVEVQRRAIEMAQLDARLRDPRRPNTRGIKVPRGGSDVDYLGDRSRSHTPAGTAGVISARVNSRPTVTRLGATSI